MQKEEKKKRERKREREREKYNRQKSNQIWEVNISVFWNRIKFCDF